MKYGRLKAAITASLTISAFAVGGGTAHAESSQQPDSYDGVIVSAPGADVVQFPDGTYVKFPDDSVSVHPSPSGTETVLPSGTIIQTPSAQPDGAASRGVYPPITIWYSRADVEEMWRAKNNINNICRLIPLSYLGSIGCSAPANLSAALDQAHYQAKRIKALYYQCSSGTYCSYYTYQVAA